jgi:transcription elongation factor GreA-like protein
LKFTGQEAQNILGWLIQEGKLTTAFVRKALTRREAAIRELRAKLTALEGGEVKKFKKTVAKVEKKARKRMTAARKASLKLHGQYLGTIRMLSAASKAEVKKIRATHGVQKAIAAAKKMGKKA